MLIHCVRALILTAALPALLWPQALPRRPLLPQSFAEPPVPPDPLELVSNNAQAVQDAEQRQAASALIANARALANVRAQPYDLKTTFVSYGSSSSDGNWSLEDTSPGRNVYRWTAQGPGYSAVSLYNNQRLYSNQQPLSIPLRLAQVRDAIFFTYQGTGPYMSLRTATGSLNGAEVHCVLTSAMAGGRVFVGGRNWEESEYCVDPASGALMTYSPAPGVYVRYDYSNAIRFHGKIIPGAFTISEGGRPVIEARTESVADPTGLNPALFTPAGLNSIGVGPVMTAATRVRNLVNAGAANGNANLQVVVVHGVSSPDGHLSELEVLASTDPGLNQNALDRAANWQMMNQPQSGATPQSHEVIFTLEFAGTV